MATPDEHAVSSQAGRDASDDLGSVDVDLVAAVGQDLSSTSNNSNPLASLYIPGIGPFIQMTQSGNLATGNVLLALDGIAQAGGIAMFIVGLTSPRTVLMRNDLGKPTIIPTPIVGHNSAGLGLLGTF